MIRSRFCALLLPTVCLAFAGGPAAAYELTTHARTTEQAFKDSQGIGSYLDDVGIDPNQTFITPDPDARPTPLNKLARFVNTGTPRDWMIEGAIREDDFVRITEQASLFGIGLGSVVNDELLECPVPENPSTSISRVYNHFLDPQNSNRGLAFGSRRLGPSASEWATTDTPNDQDGTPNEFSILFARLYQYQSLTLESKALRDKNTALFFRSLGQVVHLLQDMAQPQHTRNDRHGGCAFVGAQFFSGPKSWYETYADTRAQRPPVQFRTRAVPSPGLKLDGYPAPPFPRYEQFWTNAAQSGLADFSSRNFFSAGTNLSLVLGGCGGYRFPPCQLDKYAKEDKDFLIPTIRPGVNLAGKVTFYQSTIQDPITGASIPNVAVTSRSMWDEHLEARGDLELFSMNTFNYDAISDVLVPRAAGYSAGLLDFFFRGRLTAFAPPATAGQVRIRNLGKEALDGQFKLYADAPDGTRTLLFDFGSFSLAAKGTPGDTSNAFSVPARAGRRLTLVFQGTLGEEKRAAIGRVLRPRLAFTGETCVEADAKGNCTRSVVGLYRLDVQSAAASGSGSEAPSIIPLTQRQEGDNFEDRLAAWAPDGSQLAFASTQGLPANAPSQFTLWFMEDTGANRLQAIERDAQGNPIGPIPIDGRPAWSPDGKQLVFARRTGTATTPEDQLFGQRDLFLYDLTAGTVQRLTGTNRDTQLTLYDFIHPAWRPDGTALVVATVAVDLSNDPQGCGPKARNYELRLVSPTGNLGRWLTCHPDSGALLSFNDAEALNPAWTPDGQGVVFAQTASQSPEAGTDLWLVQPAAQPDDPTKTPPRTRLTQGVATDPVLARPTVAPDGKTVALASKLTTAPHIYAFDYAFHQIPPAPAVTPAQATCLTCTSPFNFESATQPAWSPGLP